MRILLDSHVAVWAIGSVDRLGEDCRDLLVSAEEAFFSAITPWELAIKKALGELDLPDGFAEELRDAGFDELPIVSGHGERAGSLTLHHRDPFDRMLVAQAQLESLVLVTADDGLRRYDVDIIDARV